MINQIFASFTLFIKIFLEFLTVCWNKIDVSEKIHHRIDIEAVWFTQFYKGGIG